MKSQHFVSTITVSFLLLIQFSAFTQPVYESSDFAGVNDSFILSNISLLQIGSFNYDLAGANVTWDYSGFNPVSQEVFQFTNPNRTGFSAAYLFTCNSNCYNSCYNSCVAGGGNPFVCAGSCNFNCNIQCLNKWANEFDLAELSNDSINLGITTIRDVYNFYDISASGLSQIAIGAKLSGFPLIIEYQNPDQVYKFPMTYNDVSTSNSNYSLYLDSIPGTGINVSLGYNHGQVRTNHVEGWGTLKTPFGTFQDVLKLKSVTQTRDSIIFLGDTITLSQFLPSQILPDSIVEYKWFSKDYGIPLLKVTAWVINGNKIYQDLEYIDSLRCFDPSAIFGYLPFPAIINANEDSIELNFYSLSVNGDSLFWNFKDTSSSANEAYGQNPSHWFSEQGLYQVELVTCNTACINTVCDTTTLPVLVIKEPRPTGIANQNTSLSFQVELFPNPVTNEFSVKFQLEQEQLIELDLLDITGKKIKPLLNGKYPPGTFIESFDTQTLADGLYLIGIRTDNSVGFLRFIKNR